MQSYGNDVIFTLNPSNTALQMAGNAPELITPTDSFVKELDAANRW
jgi:hypothetical protein